MNPLEFNLQPMLEGHLFRLRPLEPNDFESLFSVASDPLIWEQHLQSYRYKRDVFKVYFEDALKSKGALIVEDIQFKKVAGCSIFYELNPQKKSVVIGYTFLERSYWGGLFNRELKRLMLDHAFQYVDKVYFYVGEKNLRSRKALERIGALFVETVSIQGQNRLIYKMTPEQIDSPYTAK